MYQGAESNVGLKKSPLGPTADAIVRLCQGMEGLNHTLFLDNFFTTYDLISELQKRDIYMVGTLSSGRGRGSSCVVTSPDNITITRWVDNKPVHMMVFLCRKGPYGQC